LRHEEPERKQKGTVPRRNKRGGEEKARVLNCRDNTFQKKKRVARAVGRVSTSQGVKVEAGSKNCH